jgi:hypothetical protein
LETATAVSQKVNCSSSRIGYLPILAVTIFLLAVVSTGCKADNSSAKCVIGLTSPAPTSTTVSIGKAARLGFSVIPDTCDVAPENYSYLWLENGQDLSEETTYDFWACPSKLGENLLEVQMLRDGAIVSGISWNINVVDIAPQLPDCYDSALKTLKNGDLKGKDSGTDFIQAAQCIEGFLEDYPCSVEGNFVAFFTRFMVLIHTFIFQGPFYLMGAEEGLAKFSELNLDPLIDRLKIVRDEGGNDYNFIIEDFEFDLFDAIHIAGFEFVNLKMDLAGEWDQSEVKTLLAATEMVKGAVMTTASYDGLFDMVLSVLNIADGLKMLYHNPQMMTLAGNDGTLGTERMREAQIAFVSAFNDLESAFQAIYGEIDDQSNDIIKYLDCGSDGICPPSVSLYAGGDPAEPFVDEPQDGEPANGIYDQGEEFEDLNGNREWNDSWAATGGDPNEANGHYDQGEPLGVDILTEQGRFVVFVPDFFEQLLTLLAENIQGPGALDIDALALSLGLFEEGGLDALFLALNLQIPEIRLWELFDNPPDLRDLVPLYNRNTWSFFIQYEEEPYEDVGYDSLPDKCEGYYLEDFPENLSDDCRNDYHRSVNPIFNDLYGIPVSDGGNQPFDALENPDPSRDNFNILNNADDGFDNDKDGDIDEEGLGGLPGDLGREKNLLFDWQDDSPKNGAHDSDEVCEPFFDVGVEGRNDFIGVGNGRWDAMDLDHYWPTGEYVAGPEVNLVYDPLNGTLYEIDTHGLIDPFYFFFPDPTISGVLTFAETTRNIAGENLTQNAEIHRIISRIYRYYVEQNILGY